MEKQTRNQLRNTITKCRKLLDDAIRELLEGQYGIYLVAKGKLIIEEAGRMSHLGEEELQNRGQMVIHLGHIRAGGFSDKDAFEQFVREAAFTHLNRFCAYKMMETRHLIREAVSRGIKSQGFMFYLADHPEDEKRWNSGQAELAYRHFLLWQGSSFAREIPALFNEHDIANYLFPPHRTVEEVLELLNNEALQDIWDVDETLGWVYQYFTPKELREKARKESAAPRNSYELAFRNQFYTPRYVVEFLSDNTLGRTWYEMRKGDTILKERCQYLVRRPAEIFLAAGETAPEASEDNSEKSQEELLKEPVHIPHRLLKDPRDLKTLDPACGSGHFLLYCFDLLAEIYIEAWEKCPQVFKDLRSEGLDEREFIRRIPALILQHNLYGIDIDRRACQIAALGLWLRAQRAYRDMGFTAGERPPITRANIVCAEPMPGNEELLNEFLQDLHPPLLGQLVHRIFERMKLAGEAGSLLKIDEELSGDLQRAREEWLKRPKREQLELFPETKRRQPQQLEFDLSGITNEKFWEEARERVLETLQAYAEHAANGKGLARQLFAEDAAQGFNFVDLSFKRFDTILMNPPYGNSTKYCEDNYLKQIYSKTWTEIYGIMLERGLELLKTEGFLGALTSRTFVSLPRLKSLRKEIILQNCREMILVDLGFEVLDNALVSTAAYILRASKNKHYLPSIFVNLKNLKNEDIPQALSQSLNLVNSDQSFRYVLINLAIFNRLPDTQLAYDASEKILKLFSSKIEPKYVNICSGVTTLDNERFLRNYWEISKSQVNKNWFRYVKGGDYSPIYYDQNLVIKWSNAGEELKEFIRNKTNGAPSRFIANTKFYGRSGVTYTRITVKGFNSRLLQAGHIFDATGITIFPKDKNNLFYCGYVNSTLSRYLLMLQSDRRKWEKNMVGSLPIPPRSLFTNDIENMVLNVWKLLQNQDTQNEISNIFISPVNDIILNRKKNLKDLKDNYEKNSFKLQDIIKVYIDKIDEIIYNCFRIDTFTRNQIDSEISTLFDFEDEQYTFTSDKVISNFTSYIIGTIWGRWDLRVTLNPDLIPNLPDPFDPQPVCPPGMLVGTDGLPATADNIVSEEWLRARPNAITLPPAGSVQNPTISEKEYPIRIDWDGILVDDPDHSDDIICRLRDVLEVLWKERADAIEKEACEILGIKELREYFRKPGNGGFWTDHVKRYSKSRRKAPIYWLLQSSQKNYALWLYYHRLDKDMLFKALVNYVEPKLRLEESHLQHLKGELSQAGTGGTRVKQLEKEIDRQESFLSELRDFEEKLRKVANLNLEFDLNDGVILNIALLWELVPWKEAQKYWEELLDGKYEWSSMGKQLREKGLVK